MITLMPYCPGSALGLRYKDLEMIGDLAFSQLSELRHRGAFSTVSQTFSNCCKRCVEVDNQNRKRTDPLMSNLPKKWYRVGQFQ